MVEEIMEQVEANDAASIYVLANSYHHRLNCLQQDWAKAMELYSKSAELGFSESEAHSSLGNIYHEGGDMKKTKFHFEAAAMAGHKRVKYNLGIMEAQSGNMEQAVKHWTIVASAGEYNAMHFLIVVKEGSVHVSRELIDSILAAYNSSCAKMRSEARDA